MPVVGFVGGFHNLQGDAARRLLVDLLLFSASIALAVPKVQSEAVSQ